MEDKASPVIGPVVSSERMTSRNGQRNTLGSISVISAGIDKEKFVWLYRGQVIYALTKNILDSRASNIQSNGKRGSRGD